PSRRAGRRLPRPLGTSGRLPASFPARYTAGTREVHEGPPEAAVPPATTAFPRLTGAFLWTPGEKRPRKPDFCSAGETRRREGAAYDRSFGQDNAPRAAGRARTGLPGGRVYDGGAHRRGARHRAPFAVPARRPALVPGRPLLAGRVPTR